MRVIGILGAMSDTALIHADAAADWSLMREAA